MHFCRVGTSLNRFVTINTTLDMVVASFLETDGVNIILVIYTLIDIGEFIAFYVHHPADWFTAAFYLTALRANGPDLRGLLHAFHHVQQAACGEFLAGFAGFATVSGSHEGWVSTRVETH